MCNTAAAGEKFHRRDGILYHQYSPPGADSNIQDIEQLVLPSPLRSIVLKLAHNIPMAGHLGKKTTVNRILSRFYWPGLHHNVDEHCGTISFCFMLEQAIQKDLISVLRS